MVDYQKKMSVEDYYNSFMTVQSSMALSSLTNTAVKFDHTDEGEYEKINSQLASEFQKLSGNIQNSKKKEDYIL